MNQHIKEAVRRVIIEKVPGIRKLWYSHTCGVFPCPGCDKEEMTEERSIYLSDVLAALGEKYAIDGTGVFLERQYGGSGYECAGGPRWDLTKPLEDQSEEVWQFLADLLIPTK